MMPLTPVVKQLLILNVIMFIVTHMTGEWGMQVMQKAAAYYPGMGEQFQPFQIVSYMFLHGSVGHIFFNMLGLVIFGAMVEYVWQAKRFLFYYLATGLGALAFHYLSQLLGYSTTYSSVVGASGAVFGVMVAAAMQFPDREVQMFFFPVPMKIKTLVMFYVAASIFKAFLYHDNVAHFAHLGGALSGYLLILYWRKSGERLY